MMLYIFVFVYMYLHVYLYAKYAMLRGASWGTCTTFLPLECCPKSIRTTLNRIFSCAMLFEASWATAQGFFYLCDVVPGVLKQH